MIKFILGQGKFAIVKLGIYLPNNQKVDIKILEKNRIVEKYDEIWVKWEFDILFRFEYPNVWLVAEIFESEDKRGFIMQWNFVKEDYIV